MGALSVFTKAMKADADGLAGIYKGKKGDLKLKPGYTAVDESDLSRGATATEGILAKIQRNPNRTAAAVTGIGGAYYMMG